MPIPSNIVFNIEINSEFMIELVDLLNIHKDKLEQVTHQYVEAGVIRICIDFKPAKISIIDESMMLETKGQEPEKSPQ